MQKQINKSDTFSCVLHKNTPKDKRGQKTQLQNKWSNKYMIKTHMTLLIICAKKKYLFMFCIKHIKKEKVNDENGSICSLSRVKKIMALKSNTHFNLLTQVSNIILYANKYISWNGAADHLLLFKTLIARKWSEMSKQTTSPVKL